MVAPEEMEHKLSMVRYGFKRGLTAKCPGFTESATRTSKYAPIAGMASYSLSCGNSVVAGAVRLGVLRGVVGGETMPIAVVGGSLLLLWLETVELKLPRRIS